MSDTTDTACPTCGANGVIGCVGLDGADHEGRPPYFNEKVSAVLDSMARVQALADQWNETPDYTPSDYDRGRVDQRHDMTGQLLEALEAGETVTRAARSTSRPHPLP